MGGRAMDRVRLLRLDRGALVHRLADHVEDPASVSGPTGIEMGAPVSFTVIRA